MLIRQADTKRSKYLACQRKVLEAMPSRLKAELPKALGMSAQATSVHLGPRNIDSLYLPGSDFHLMVTYRHQICGEIFGALSTDLKHVIISDLTADLSMHVRAEWLTSLAGIRFAENYGARLHTEAILILHPSDVMMQLSACLGFETASLPDIGFVAQGKIQPLPARSQKRSTAVDGGRQSSAMAAGDAISPYSGTSDTTLSPYQLKAIRSVIGVDNLLSSASPRVSAHS